MFKEIQQKSLEENKFLSYPIISFVKIKGKDCRCEMHKELRMNPGNLKSHIRKTHKLNFETGNRLEINQEALHDLPEEKISQNPVKLMLDLQDNYFWELLRKVKAISKIKDPKYAMLVVKHSLLGEIKEDFLKILEEKSRDLNWEKMEQQMAKRTEEERISDKIDARIDSMFSTRPAFN